MKIDPVWLVQPRADRRVFLMAAGAFVLGGAGGYGLRVLQEPGTPVPQKPEKTGNPELDELRRLAVEAPIEELSTRYVEFVTRRGRAFAEDEVLVVGLRRLVRHVLATQLPDRGLRARFLLRDLGVGRASRDAELQSMVPQLQAVAK
ncbi:MAG: hypothetical protein IPK26_26635 [Planctomycetes bacterium]|nr:hypothetical protein [Planctomycetota bacterium]